MLLIFCYDYAVLTMYYVIMQLLLKDIRNNNVNFDDTLLLITFSEWTHLRATEGRRQKQWSRFRWHHK